MSLPRLGCKRLWLLYWVLLSPLFPSPLSLLDQSLWGKPAATWKGHSGGQWRGHLVRPTSNHMGEQAWKWTVQPQVSLDKMAALANSLTATL